MYTVYKLTFPNNKVYIGTTSQKPENRWRNGEGYKKQSEIYEDIKKYGWDNIKHEVLFNSLTEEEAYNKEKELIALYDTTNKNNGYNVATGGKGTYGVDRKGNKNGRYKKGYLVCGKNNPRAKSVICITTKRIFLTAKEGAEFYNTNNANIITNCKGRLKSSGKLKDGTPLVWRYLIWNHNKTYRIINT